MIEALGLKLYSADEVASLLGVGRETLSKYSQIAGVEKRLLNRVRYYTEEDIKKILLRPVGTPGRKKKGTENL